MKLPSVHHRSRHAPQFDPIVTCNINGEPNLLARDLLSKFGITIYCTKDGLRLHIPGEETPDPHCHRMLYPHTAWIYRPPKFFGQDSSHRKSTHPEFIDVSWNGSHGS